MTNRNTLARATDQRVRSSIQAGTAEITVHDKGHSPSFRRPGSRGEGEVTMKAAFENGLPVLSIIIREGYHRSDGPAEWREAKFELIGSSAIEAFETMRTVVDTGQGFVKGRII